ncbi:MAG: TrlF family AAA-like ATPase [Planctomycetota bacterium]
MTHSNRGSLWHRWDLHFHTPSSFDYGNKGVTDQQIVDRLLSEGLRVVAITDHHTMDVARIGRLQELGKGKITFLPGIELRSEHGGKPINYICIFPEDCQLKDVWTTLQGRLGLTEKDLVEKGGDHKIYVPMKEGATVTRELGGVVSIHAGVKSNSIEEISNATEFQQRLKYDITKQWVDLMEIGQIKDIDTHLTKIFPSTGLDRPLILCSDNHNINEYSMKGPLWLRADPTFRGLLMVLREPRDRAYIGTRPPEVVRVEQNPTKYIKSIAFERRAGSPPAEVWFSGTVELSSGLIAIVGNKGSGKSALADTLGLLGSTKNGPSFSFLSAERFRHPSGGFADRFEATLTWESGEKTKRRLSDLIMPEEVERLKYLPQNHVEKVCNELAHLGEAGFERELKAVIFSHVPDSERLGNATLDDVVAFRTGERQKRIDSLLKLLRDESRTRAALEAQQDPVVRREMEEKTKRRQLELDAHGALKPAEVTNPAVGTITAPGQTEKLRELDAAEATKKTLTDRIATGEEEIARLERRSAVAVRLFEKLANFQKDFTVFKASLDGDARELGLDAAALVTFDVQSSTVEKVRSEALARIAALKHDLDGTEPPGARQQVSAHEAVIADLKAKLDAPNRAYQGYLASLAEWDAKRIAIEGTEKDPESLVGLKAATSALDDLPARVMAVRNKQIQIALEVWDEKAAQAAVYRTLYGAVQTFIEGHALAKDKLKLEFRAELTNEGVQERVLNLLAQNRRGSFMGVDEGRARMDALVQNTRWEDRSSVRRFLDAVDGALHADQRDKTPLPTQLKDQLAKNRKPEEVFDLLYGLEYVRPRYILRWEGKDISMLSPGERGTLLLVFYLLIDKSDIPLVIDQPEGNLDNHTVAMVLVECIKETRRRRQVFIVTHNPNLAVVCDADQVIHAHMDKIGGNAVTYTTGALENPVMNKYVTDVLEGTRWAFGVRGAKYEVGQ